MVELSAKRVQGLADWWLNPRATPDYFPKLGEGPMGSNPNFKCPQHFGSLAGN